MDSNTITIEATCGMCQQTKTLTLPASGWIAYKSGVLIQRALPSVSEGDRELLISQTCGPCFDKLFDEEDSFDEERTNDR
jgi:hypothetical protein